MDDQQTAPQRTCLVARLRDVAEYHLGNDLIGRMQEAAYFQQMQRAALTEAADEIDRLRQELAK
jgi:hypothetical protein